MYTRPLVFEGVRDQSQPQIVKICKYLRHVMIYVFFGVAVLVRYTRVPNKYNCLLSLHAGNVRSNIGLTRLFLSNIYKQFFRFQRKQTNSLHNIVSYQKSFKVDVKKQCTAEFNTCFCSCIPHVSGVCFQFYVTIHPNILQTTNNSLLGSRLSSFLLIA